jgi:hypothetical protein
MWGIGRYYKRKASINCGKKYLFTLMILSIFSFNSFSQVDEDEKRVSGILTSGGELSFLQNVISGGANLGVLLNASFYYKLTPSWEAGLGADIMFGNVIGNRAVHANIRRNFNRSFIYFKVGANQGVMNQPQLLNTRYEPRHFLAVGYGYRFGKVLVYSEVLHKRFVALTTTNENLFSSNIDAVGLRIGIGLEL